MNYVYSVMTVTIAAAVVDILVCGTRFERYVRLALALCVVSALAAPIASFENLSLLPDEIESYGSESGFSWDDSLLAEKIRENVASSVAEAAEAKFGIGNIDVKVDSGKNERGEIIIEKVTIIFKDRGGWYRSADVKKYISDLIGTETEVRLNEQ